MRPERLQPSDPRLADLAIRLREVLDGLSLRAGQTLLSVTLPAPVLELARLPVAAPGAVCWSSPRDDEVRFAMGSAWLVEVRGAPRFELLDRAMKNLAQGWQHEDPDGTGHDAQAFTAFAFDPLDRMAGRWGVFPNACLEVPQLLYQCKNGCASLTFSMVTGEATTAQREWMAAARRLFSTRPGACHAPRGERRTRAFPHRSAWEARVGDALAQIRAGRLDKVVLTRRLRVTGPGTGLAPEVLLHLRESYQAGIQFSVNRGGMSLVGNSPERLVSLRGGRVSADAVAGTCMCRTAALNGVRLEDRKSRQEQAMVVAAIAAALRDQCESVMVPRTPRQMQFGAMSHLHSRITGRVRQGVSLLDLAARLHPTPAVGGVPVSRALPWLASSGEEPRGWYTGALGWIGREGEGELSVILRCALLQEGTADLFAGAGIVDGSIPAVEFTETEWKLRVMLEALQAGAADGR